MIGNEKHRLEISERHRRLFDLLRNDEIQPNKLMATDPAPATDLRDVAHQSDRDIMAKFQADAVASLRFRRPRRL